jgi:hypothetical protein
MKKFFALAVLAASLTATTALATPAITSFTVGSSFTGFDTDETVGWSFTANSAITVVQLGWFAVDGTLDASHEVGIWTTSGTLLGSATVTDGAADSTGFRYVGVTPFALTAGTSYVIGGRDLVGDGDNYTSSNSALVMAPEVSFLQAARSDNGTGFTFPNLLTSNSGGRFGPNFTFRPTQTTSVSEPASLLLLGAGLTGLLVASRRRKTA